MRPLACLLLALPLTAQESSTGKPPQAGFRELQLGGRGYVRGLQHGKALAAEIRGLLAALQADLRRALQGADPEDFWRSMLERSQFEAAVRVHTPDLHAEVHGIADGAGLPFWKVFALQLIDETWAMGKQLGRHKCTSLGIDRRGSQPTIVAQNLDIPAFMHKHRVLLRIAKEGAAPAQLVVTLPGLIGACGLNAGGVGVAVNTLLQLQPRADGLPVAFVVRGLLAQKDYGAARRFLYAVPHACGQNYILGGRQLARSFECSAAQIRIHRPVAGAPFTFHTNHPLQNEDWNRAWLAQLGLAQPGAGDPRQKLPACPRYAALQQRLPAGVEPDLAQVQALLATAAGPDGKGAPISNQGTVAGVIMLLGARPELRLSAGRPDRVPFVRFFLER